MKRRVVLAAAWCVANPMQVRLLIVLALILTAILIPATAVLAGDAPGGGHPYP